MWRRLSPGRPPLRRQVRRALVCDDPTSALSSSTGPAGRVRGPVWWPVQPASAAAGVPRHHRAPPSSANFVVSSATACWLLAQTHLVHASSSYTTGKQPVLYDSCVAGVVDW